MSNIEWTEETWNFIFGCSHASTGCKNCYAEAMSHRLSKMKHTAERYSGVTSERRRFTGQINFDEKSLLKPLGIKKPTVFFISMSDLFHENVKDEWIDKAFAVMALCPQHTFQILTKRPERMRDYLHACFDGEIWDEMRSLNQLGYPFGVNISHWQENGQEFIDFKAFPLPNVWLGVSCENQKTADERIPLLLETPAAIRFLSCEPLLEGINLADPIMSDAPDYEDDDGITYFDLMEAAEWDYLGHKYIPKHDPMLNQSFCEKCGNRVFHPMHNNRPDSQDSDWQFVDWVIVGGESGSGARPCNIEWIRSIVNQCKEAEVPVFVKQLGKHPRRDGAVSDLYISDNKGGKIEEFPEDLRVRQMPGF